MRKRLFQVFMTTMLSLSMTVTPVDGQAAYASTVANETTNKGTTEESISAYFCLLKKGEKRPEGTDFSGVSYYPLNYGKVSKGTEICNDGEAVEEYVVETPERLQKYLGENEEVRWFTMTKPRQVWYVYGEIVDKATPSPEPAPTEVPVSAYFCLLEKGQERPEGTDFSGASYYPLSYGKVSKGLEICNDEEEVEEYIVETPERLQKYLGENEEVRWFTMTKPRQVWYVYGEIVSTDNVEVDGAIQLTATPVVTKTPVTTATPVVTKAPVTTATPMVTKAPAATATPVVTKVPVKIGFQLLKAGQQRPTTLDFSGYEFHWCNYGTVTESKQVCNDVQKVESMIVQNPEQVDKYLEENEAVRWFTIKQQGYAWYVYGEIYNTIVENSDAPWNNADYLTFDTVEDVRNFNEKLQIGTVIETLGYYEKGDGGAAKYVVGQRGTGSDFLSVKLSTGQYANYVMENDTVNMAQIGAGRCEQITTENPISNNINNDDAQRLNDAINFINQNGGGTIYFPAGEYRCATKVNMGGANYTIKGDGNKSILYTDNGYVGDEHFLTISGAENVTVDGIRVEARETRLVGYFRQCSIMFSSNIKILNCEFSVKENVIKDDNSTDKQYTNITLYSGWHNVVVDNCDLEQMGCVERGACVGVIDMWGNGCTNATITNCTMKQNAHDEMMGIFALRNTTVGIDGVYVANNTMYAASASNVSTKTMAITVAYNDSKAVRNVTFKNNYIKAELPSNFMTFGQIDNCVIEENVFDIVHTAGTRGAMFDANEGVLIQNNTIKVSSKDNGGFQNLFKGGATFYNNDVDCDAYCYLGSYMGSVLLNNKMTFRKGVNAVAMSPRAMKNNEIVVDGYMANIIHYETINYDSDVTNNTFTYLYDDSKEVENYNVSFAGAAVYAGFHAALNDYTVNFSNNTVFAPNCSAKNKHLLSYGTDGANPQNFVLENNVLEKYVWVRDIYGKDANITYDNNADVNGAVLDYEAVQVKYLKNVQ